MNGEIKKISLDGVRKIVIEESHFGNIEMTFFNRLKFLFGINATVKQVVAISVRVAHYETEDSEQRKTIEEI